MEDQARMLRVVLETEEKVQTELFTRLHEQTFANNDCDS
jgi:hypothetical protein